MPFFLPPAALLSSSSTNKAKRGKFGNKKGKSIDINAGFQSWQNKAPEKHDDISDEETPATRKETTILFLYLYLLLGNFCVCVSHVRAPLFWQTL
jgi:hypothetical protein